MKLAAPLAAMVVLIASSAALGVALLHAPRATGAERGTGSTVQSLASHREQVRAERAVEDTAHEAVVATQEPAAEHGARTSEPARLLRLAIQGELRTFTPFGPDGEVIPEAFEQLTRAFAPPVVTWRTKTPEPEPAVAPDPRLIELLMDISDELGNRPLIVVSGARKPGKGTSHRSYHVRGMAVDIAVDGLKPIELRKAALRAGAKGVGLYRRFVHVDVRDVPYKWGGR